MIRFCSKLLVPLPNRSTVPIFVCRRFASTDNCKPPLIPRRVKRVFYTATGLTIIGIGGAVVYAKQDPEFRKQLETYVPGSDKFISFVFQESGEISFEKITDQILSLPSEIYKQGSEAIEGLAKLTEKETETKSIKKDSAPKTTSPDKSSKGEEKAVDDGKLVIPVLKIGDEAVSLYKEAIKLLEGKENKIADLIDKAVEENDLQLWNSIRKQIDEQSKNLENVEKIEKQADELNKKYLSEKRSLLSKNQVADHNVKDFSSKENQMRDLKNKYQSLKNLKLEGEKNYFNKIEAGRKHFLEELNTLFPGTLSDRQLKLTETEIDLFLYYAVQKLNYYQKEIAKLETQASNRLKKVVEGNPSLQEVIDGEVSKAKRQIKEDFDKKTLDLKLLCEKQLHEQMKRQEQVHIDLLKDQLKLKEKEIERTMLQHQEEKIQQEKSGLTQELAEMTAKMQGLNEAIAKRALQDKRAQTSQGLWSASEALYNNLKRSGSEAAAVLKPKPLSNNVEAIKNAAAEGDDFVETIVATIPKIVLDRGVYPEDTLRERFLKVESVAWRVAGVPEGGASLPMLLWAWMQSILVIRSSEPIPSNELRNEPIDAHSLDNYDVLQRARYWVDRGDLEQALRYMNLLKGGARSVSSDWIKEVTLLLEVKMAANVLLAHASASGMMYA